MDSPVTFAMVAMAFVTTLGSTVTGILNFLKERDARRFDVRLKNLEEHKEECEKDRVEWQSARKAMQEEWKTIADRCGRAEQQMAKLEGELRASERESTQLRQEVVELRDRLYGKPK